MASSFLLIVERGTGDGSAITYGWKWADCGCYLCDDSPMGGWLGSLK